jgi:hypothetical protein
MNQKILISNYWSKLVRIYSLWCVSVNVNKQYGWGKNVRPKRQVQITFFVFPRLHRTRVLCICSGCNFVVRVNTERWSGSFQLHHVRRSVASSLDKNFYRRTYTFFFLLRMWGTPRRRAIDYRYADKKGIVEYDEASFVPIDRSWLSLLGWSPLKNEL